MVYAVRAENVSIRYMKLARADLLKNMSFRERLRVAKKHTRKRDRAYLAAICFNLPWMVRMLNRRFENR